MLHRTDPMDLLTGDWIVLSTVNEANKELYFKYDEDHLDAIVMQSYLGLIRNKMVKYLHLHSMVWMDLSQFSKKSKCFVKESISFPLILC